ncbi:hypothetical protein EIN_026760, partial [Entamoeba invadens IP1]|uniref:hypothetical protein n=1 Tax=Entamoeba invadens IP1 TaxID=370355 RepID=UPI0002C3D47F
GQNFTNVSLLYSASQQMVKNKTEIIDISHDLIGILEKIIDLEKKEKQMIESKQRDIIDCIGSNLAEIRDAYHMKCDSRDYEKYNDKKPRPREDEDYKRKEVRDDWRDERERRYERRDGGYDDGRDNHRGDYKDDRRDDRRERTERRDDSNQGSKLSIGFETRDKFRQFFSSARSIVEAELVAMLEKKSKEGVVLYDTDKDGWDMNNFVNKVNGKSQIAFTVFDQSGHLFGVFIYEQVKRGEWIDDFRIFMFSYQQGTGKPLFYSGLKQAGNGGTDGSKIFKLGDNSANYFFQVADLFSLQNRRDVKESFIRGDIDNVFYSSNAKAFCGHVFPDMFEPTRVLALQTKI